MEVRSLLLTSARVSLVCSLLVVLAGSVVRMTGSGMGCPDWPKCFGYYIPPTDIEQVLWHPHHEVEKGQMIVHDEALWIAKSTFTTGDQLIISNWEKYTRHDYAIFNPAHTWTEYINRLVGAFTGLPVLLTFVLSFFFLRKKVWIPLFATLSLFTLGFEAWLGKLVVDGNLVPNQITIHMFGALALVAFLLILIRLIKGKADNYVMGKVEVGVMIAVLAMTLLQVYMGTAVREEVDIIAHSGVARSSWVDSLSVIFKVHRSFSILVLALNGYLLWKLKIISGKLNLIVWASILVFEILLGIGLTYLSFPSFMQPLHLLSAFVLFGIQFDVLTGMKIQSTH